MRILRNPVAQFLALGLVTLVAVVALTNALASRAASTEAIRDARGTTGLLARSVAEPDLPRGLVDGDPGAIDRFDRSAGLGLVAHDVRRIKIWGSDGTILYSDEPRLIGERFDLGGDEQEILEQGGTDAEVSDLSQPENRFERGGDGLVEVYTRIRSPEGQPLLFEAYFSAADISARQASVLQPFQRITAGGLLLLVAAATPLIWLLHRRSTAAAHERERLAARAVRASEGERRRIARDLHDGVVQDLAGTAFSLAALARDEPEPGRRSTLGRAATSVRASVTGLRSLLVEIHPPDLHAAGLGAALEDLLAPASRQGVRASASLELGEREVDDGAVALVWRVAQETVRNCLRHAGAGTLEVLVHVEGDLLVLEVADDGCGFRPDLVADPDRFGLRGLTSLAEDHGGHLEVRSLPGDGTTVRLVVPLSQPDPHADRRRFRR